jgi:hypothetical protein
MNNSNTKAPRGPLTMDELFREYGKRDEPQPPKQRVFKISILNPTGARGSGGRADGRTGTKGGN